MIISEKQYNEVLNQIDVLMKKGENNLNDTDISLLKSLIEEVSIYEQKHIDLPTLEDIAEAV